MENDTNEDMKNTNDVEDASVIDTKAKLSGSGKKKKKFNIEKMESIEIKSSKLKGHFNHLAKKKQIRSRMEEVATSKKEGNEDELNPIVDSAMENDNYNKESTKWNSEGGSSLIVDTVMQAAIEKALNDNFANETVTQNIEHVKDQLNGSVDAGSNSHLGINGDPKLFPGNPTDSEMMNVTDGDTLRSIDDTIIAKMMEQGNNQNVKNVLSDIQNKESEQGMNQLKNSSSENAMEVDSVNNNIEGSTIDLSLNEKTGELKKTKTDAILDTNLNVINQGNTNSNISPTFAQMVDSNKQSMPSKIKTILRDPKKKHGIVEMPISNLLSGSAPYHTTLIGSFIDKKLAFPTVKYFVNRMWKQFGIEDLMVNDEGYYFFKFSTVQGMFEVMENGPWLINNVPIFVQRWKPGLVLSKPAINMVPVWVKIYNVPLEYWNEEGVAHIANEIGKPIMMDKMTLNMCENHWGRPGFMRILVEMTADEEWLKSLDVVSRDIDSGERKISKCRVEYAWWPSRCSNCKIYGHNDNNCCILLAKNAIVNNGGKGIQKEDGKGRGKEILVDEQGYIVRKQWLQKMGKKEVKRDDQKQGTKIGNGKLEQGQIGKEKDVTGSNFNKFAVGGLKQGKIYESLMDKRENQILKPKKVYVPVSKQDTVISAKSDRGQENKENVDVRKNVNVKKEKMVKTIANRFEILNNKELVLDDMVIGEDESDDDVDEYIEMETEKELEEETPVFYKGIEGLTVHIVINGLFVLSTGSILGSRVVGFYAFFLKKQSGFDGCHNFFSYIFSVAVFLIWTCVQIFCSECVIRWCLSVSSVFIYSHTFDTACWHCIFCCTIYWHMHTDTAHFADHDPTGESARLVMRLYSQGFTELVTIAGSRGHRTTPVGTGPDATGPYGASGRVLILREHIYHYGDERRDTRGLRGYGEQCVSRPFADFIFCAGDSLRCDFRDCYIFIEQRWCLMAVILLAADQYCHVFAYYWSVLMSLLWTTIKIVRDYLEDIYRDRDIQETIDQIISDYTGDTFREEDLMEHILERLINLAKDFLQNFADAEGEAKYISILQDVAIRKVKAIEIDLGDLFDYKDLDEEFVGRVTENTRRYVGFFADAIDELIPEPTEAFQDDDLDILMTQRAEEGNDNADGTDPIFFMKYLEYPLRTALEATKSSLIQGTTKVLLDFRLLLDEELGLILKLRGKIIGWIHEGFQTFFRQLDDQLLLVSGQQEHMVLADKVPAGVVLVISHLSLFIERDAISRITEEIGSSLALSGGRGYEYSPNFVPGEVRNTFRSAAERFLQRYINMRTLKISLLLKKRLTTPNWVKHKEPREVHMFVDMFLQELGAVGREVKQVLPQGLTRKHARTESNGSTSSSRRNTLRDDKINRSNANRARSQLLETHLAKLFKQKMEIFTKVEHTQESVVMSIVKFA
ncbi:hypothetical protein LXL04_022527 [Taraxacum kok-saghyz]